MRFRGHGIGLLLAPGNMASGGSSWNPALSTPSALTLSVISDTQIDGSFTINGTGQDGHKIYISTDGVNYTLKGTVTGITATYSATGLTAYTEYFFYVKPYKGSNVGNRSNIAYATTQATSKIKDGNSVAWFNNDSIVNNVNNGYPTPEISVLWDMLYGSSTLGAEQDSGNIVRFAVYKITATQANFFYTGCVVGDTFVCNVVKTCDANNKVQRYSGNHLSTATNGTYPKYYSDRISLDGLNDYLQTAPFTYNQPEHIYLVVKQVAWVANRALCDGVTTISGLIMQSTATPDILAHAGTASSRTNKLAIGKYGIVRALFNGAGSKLQINAEDPITGNFGATNMGGFTLGNRGALGYNGNIDFKEAILRNVADSEADESILFNYLKNKYAVTDLTATVISGTQIDLAWVNTAGDQDGCRIYISDNELTYTLLDTVTGATAAYSATGLTANTNYFIKVIAYKTGVYDSYPAKVQSFTTDGNVYFSDNVADSAIHPHHYASAQYFNGKTYVAYNGDGADPYINVYDHTSGAWATPVKIAISPVTDADTGHGEPAMLIDKNGYIHILYGAHQSAILYQKSTNTEDITAWTEMTSPSDGTYPQLIEFSNGDIYVFFRRYTAPNCDWGYIKSTNSGASWADYVSVSQDFAYCTYKKGIGDTVHCAINGSLTTGTPRYNAYYLFFDGTNWKNAAGSNQTLPVRLAGNNITVRDSGANVVPLATVGCDPSNNPIILFSEGVISDEYVGVYNYKVAKYISGASWSIIDVGASCDSFIEYASAIDVESSDNVSIYINTGLGKSVPGGDMEKWSSSNGGLMWERERVILSGMFKLPAVVKDHITDAILLFSDHRNDPLTFTGKIYLWGDNGFLT